MMERVVSKEEWWRDAVRDVFWGILLVRGHDVYEREGERERNSFCDGWMAGDWGLS